MAQDVDVCNLALTFVGSGAEIASLTESSAEARACNRVYETARDETLGSFPWPFSRRQAALGLVSKKGDANHPSSEYTYAYRYPADCLQLRKILSGLRIDARETRVSYDLLADEAGTLIMTDRADAVAEYTSTLGQNPGRWTADFQKALAYYVAYLIAPRLTKGDPFKMGDKCYQLYQRALAGARSCAANEVQPDQDPPEALILSRY